jgi:thymidine kinase
MLEVFQMAKLYFRYGVMSSSKTLNCLAVAHNYETYQDKPVFLIKPSLASNGEYVESQTGLKRKADLILKPSDIDILPHILKTKQKIYCVLIDEAQYLTEIQVYELTEIVDKLKIPVICYGLKTNYQNNFHGFGGAEALIRWADKLEEIKTVCFNDHCNNKALHNLRLENGSPCFEGTEFVVLGNINSHNIEDRDITYKPVCRHCYKEEMNNYTKKREVVETCV